MKFSFVLCVFVLLMLSTTLLAMFTTAAAADVNAAAQVLQGVTKTEISWLGSLAVLCFSLDSVLLCVCFVKKAATRTRASQAMKTRLAFALLEVLLAEEENSNNFVTFAEADLAYTPLPFTPDVRIQAIVAEEGERKKGKETERKEKDERERENRSV